MPNPARLRTDPHLTELRERLRGDGPAPARASRAPSVRAWDVTHYDVDLRVDPATGALIGEETVSATRLADGPLVLDQRGLQDLVVSLPYTPGDGVIEVDVDGDSVELQLGWTAEANPFFGFVRTDDVLYTTNEPEAARQWLPCVDDPADKATLAWTIHAPADLTVAAIGDFVEVVDEGETRAWSWRMDVPTPTYLYAFHVADYVLTVSDDPIPVWTWAYPSLSATAVETFSNTYDMLAWFGRLYGPYQFSRYGNVLAPLGGAMENPGAVTYDDGVFEYPEWAELMNVHELGHHWWGDDVTLGTWDDIWLNEGFATYTEALWYEQEYGDEGRIAYAEYLTESWLESGETGALYAPDYMFGSTVYDKGGMVVHMLRGVMGDDAFFSGLRTYEETYRQQTAVTTDLMAVMEDAYGEPLDWFFDEWVYGSGTPAFTFGVAMQRYDGGTQVRVVIDQAGVDGFRMPVPVRMFLGDGTRDETIWVEGDRGEQTFCVEDDVSEVGFDPESWVLWGDVATRTVESGALTCGEALVEPGGCGCSSAPAPAWVGLVLAVLGLRRR